MHPEEEPPKKREKPGPGLAEVDPEPLSQTAGEGIDPDANEEAHRKVVEQREKRAGDR